MKSLSLTLLFLLPLIRADPAPKPDALGGPQVIGVFPPGAEVESLADTAARFARDPQDAIDIKEGVEIRLQRDAELFDRQPDPLGNPNGHLGE